MPQSLSRIIIHVIFGTKHRLPLVPKEKLSSLHTYLSGVCRKHDAEAYRVGGTENHVHIACRLPRTMTVAKLVERIKTSSSKWMKEGEFSSSTFQWQDGYGAFSISPSHLVSLMAYIDNQEEHHAQHSYEDEVRELAEKYDD